MRSGDEQHMIECKVEATTAKAWLVVDNMSGKSAWLPKSIAKMSEEGPDENENVTFTVPEWWLNKNGFI